MHLPKECAACVHAYALAGMLTRSPETWLILRGNSAGWRLGSGPGADFHAVLDREGDGQVPGPRVG
jgi:hypothetical protein